MRSELRRSDVLGSIAQTQIVKAKRQKPQAKLHHMQSKWGKLVWIAVHSYCCLPTNERGTALNRTEERSRRDVSQPD